MARFNPINTKLITEDNQVLILADTSEWTEAEYISNVPEVVFFLKGMSYALVTMDLRHVKEEAEEWTYGEDWAISFTMAPVNKENPDEVPIGFDTAADPAEMPEAFLNVKTSKSQVFEFLVFAWEDQYMRIDILLYNSLYNNYKYLF